METSIKTKTERILSVMLIVAWVAYIGYLIKTGSVIISFIVSLVNPEAVNNLSEGLNLSAIQEYNMWFYTLAVSFVASIYALQSHVWLMVIKTLSKIKLSNPFTMEIAIRLEKMSYVLASTAAIGLFANGYNDWLMKRTGENFITWNTGEFIFMAGLVFIISQIFKRGVEIQSENELTV